MKNELTAILGVARTTKGMQGREAAMTGRTHCSRRSPTAKRSFGSTFPTGLSTQKRSGLRRRCSRIAFTHRMRSIAFGFPLLRKWLTAPSPRKLGNLKPDAMHHQCADDSED